MSHPLRLGHSMCFAACLAGPVSGSRGAWSRRASQGTPCSVGDGVRVLQRQAEVQGVQGQSGWKCLRPTLHLERSRRIWQLFVTLHPLRPLTPFSLCHQPGIYTCI